MQRNDDDGGAMGRLNAMGDPNDPLVIVPATEPPGPDDLGGPATMAMPPVTERYATVAQPAVAVNRPAYVEPVVEVRPAPVVTRPIEPPVAYPPRRDWGPVLAAAFVALLIGGLVGFLIGRAGDDDESATPDTTTASSVAPAADQAAIDAAFDNVFTLLLAQADQNGSVVLPTPYPKLDQLLMMSAAGTAGEVADAETDVGALTQERDQLADQVALLETQAATLQEQLATAEQERDEAQADDGNADDAAAQITELQEALTTTQSDLDDANQDLATAQSDLATANATLDNLGVTDAQNVVGRPIGEVRNTARSNGWQLIERPVDTTSVAPDSVTLQTPAPGTTMIKGSVLYVEVARAP